MTRRCTSRRRSYGPTTTPAMTSECPLRNLVAEWTTRSAPCVEWLEAVRRRERVVDDQPGAVVARDLGRAPAGRRARAGDWSSTRRTSPSWGRRRLPRARRRDPGRPPAARRSPRPEGLEPAGPGYRRRPASPPRCGRLRDSRVSRAVEIAPMPDEVMNPASADSRSAIMSAARSTVGLRKRPYQISSSPPAWMSLYASSSRKYVTEWWIGGDDGPRSRHAAGGPRRGDPQAFRRFSRAPSPASAEASPGTQSSARAGRRRSSRCHTPASSNAIPGDRLRRSLVRVEATGCGRA